jgi:hypothetical protein
VVRSPPPSLFPPPLQWLFSRPAQQCEKSTMSLASKYILQSLTAHALALVGV